MGQWALPPGTTMPTSGQWVSTDPQMCNTLVTPTRAPSGLGSTAMVTFFPHPSEMAQSVFVEKAGDLIKAAHFRSLFDKLSQDIGESINLRLSEAFKGFLCMGIGEVPTLIRLCLARIGQAVSVALTRNEATVT